VLSAPNRLTRGVDLRHASRHGRRAGSPTVVVHLLLRDSPAPPRVGFVVGRVVGPSVSRHRVQRRLRHLCRERLDVLPRGSDLVVRALAPAREATYAELGADLDRCLQRAMAALPARSPGTVS
jgi:ribonuclease P protein component